MQTAKLPSLEQLIRAKIQRRILAAMFLLFAGAILLTGVETALSYSDLVARLNREADQLQDLVISEILVHNQLAVEHIIDDANKTLADQTVKWTEPGRPVDEAKASGLVWKFPGRWTFVRPLKKLGDQDFGTFVFSGNILTSPRMLTALTHRLAITLAICLLIALILLPIARRSPKELILGPVHHLMALLREDHSASPIAEPAYLELKSIQEDFTSLMDDRRRLESERIETAQLRSVAQTAQMLAHDIRRPFSLLKATVDGLAHASTPDAVQELLTETVPGVRKSLDHLEGIIAELTAKDTAAVKRTTFSIGETIRNALTVAVPANSGADRVSVDITGDDQVTGIQNQIERVIANIVANAFEAMGPDDRLTVTVCPADGNQLLIAITNTGSHIPEENTADIFGMFFTRGKSRGIGLGLAICNRIVANHGGKIWAESTREPDSVTFKILLPTAK